MPARPLYAVPAQTGPGAMNGFYGLAPRCRLRAIISPYAGSAS